MNKIDELLYSFKLRFIAIRIVSDTHVYDNINSDIEAIMSELNGNEYITYLAGLI